MAQIELIMPKMGESIMEATILKWVKQVGDTVEEDETILEIATDKVDSDVPSPVSGTISKILFPENDIVAVGAVIAHIETEAGATVAATPSVKPVAPSTPQAVVTQKESFQPASSSSTKVVAPAQRTGENGKFYSPLVRSMAKAENISMEELSTIPGTGQQGRVTKKDMLAYLKNRTSGTNIYTSPSPQVATSTPPIAPVMNTGDNTEIIEMDRMRKLIADHMVMSKQTSPHVTSFVEVDVTNIVNWRNKVKVDFQKKYGEKITFTPIFIEAIVKAIKDYPLINISVDGDKIIKKNYINIGMAAALPSGNLIVPVIKGADNLNLLGITRSVNDLANRARTNQLKPEEIQDGTFTLTNVGTFGNVMGTPIINQPQVAVMAVGAIRKKPAVVETEYGDLIAVRHLMFLSLSYDHRVVDGFLGGSFLRKVGDYLEAFDVNQGF